MYEENVLHVTDHMLREILDRLQGDSAPEDRQAVTRWYDQMPCWVSRNLLRNAMEVLMHGPDADTIASAVYKTRFAYDRAARLMIELAAMWYVDLDALTAEDEDIEALWTQLEDQYADYTTTQDHLPGVFGVAFEDRDDFERCYERFIDMRNFLTGSLTGWLIEHNETELAAWWLTTRHDALITDRWADVTDKPRERERLRHDAQKLGNHLSIETAVMAKRVGALFPYFRGGYNHE